jgi:hypothetical protein
VRRRAVPSELPAEGPCRRCRPHVVLPLQTEPAGPPAMALPQSRPSASLPICLLLLIVGSAGCDRPNGGGPPGGCSAATPGLGDPLLCAAARQPVRPSPTSPPAL